MENLNYIDSRNLKSRSEESFLLSVQSTESIKSVLKQFERLGSEMALIAEGDRYLGVFLKSDFNQASYSDLDLEQIPVELEKKPIVQVWDSLENPNLEKSINQLEPETWVVATNDRGKRVRILTAFEYIKQSWKKVHHDNEVLSAIALCDGIGG